jgi:hypothetical protein
MAELARNTDDTSLVRKCGRSTSATGCLIIAQAIKILNSFCESKI